MVEKPKADTSIDENEIQNTSQGRMSNYITYALSLLHVFLFLGFFFFWVKCKWYIIKKAKKIKVHPIGIQHPNH